MSAATILYLVGGLALLIVGAEALVRGASSTARLLGIPTIVIGLTIVAMGTSSPELAVSVMAALRGNADLSLGNAVGSNTFNILFILGVSAIVTPLVVAKKFVRVEVPIMIGVSILTALVAADGKIGRADGIAMVGLLAAYLGWTVTAVRKGKRRPAAVDAQKEGAERPATYRALGRNIILIAVGLVLLVLGSRWLVLGAVELAHSLGVSELIIGLTVVAAGTSVPEVATSIVAALSGERDIAVGNVVGSNIFNILGVLGLAGVVAPGGIHVSGAAMNFDVPVMIAAACACLPIFLTGFRIVRWEGFLFLGYYCAYVCFLVLDATQHHALPGFGIVMWVFFIPLTVVTIAISVTRHVRTGRRRETSLGPRDHL